MFGRDRRGFNWKEIAEVLHSTKTPARAAFWSEIKRARFKDHEHQFERKLPLWRRLPSARSHHRPANSPTSFTIDLQRQ